MTQLIDLYRQAEQLNIPVYHLPLPETGSMSLLNPDGSCAIGYIMQALEFYQKYRTKVPVQNNNQRESR